MEKINMDLLVEADWLFRKMVRKFVTERDKITIEGVMLPGFLILKKIINDGEQQLTDLAVELDFSSGAITAICDKLEGRGFAVRNRHKDDRRIILLDVTNEGRESITRNGEVGTKTISILFDGFSSEEMEKQISIFSTIINNLDGFSQKVLEVEKEKTQKKISVNDNKNLLTY